MLGAIKKNLPSNATYGWFRCFKSRFNLNKINFHGEAADIDPCTSSEWLSQLKNLCEGYSDDCIYNIDETALFYQQQRGKSYVSSIESHTKGTRKSKKRMTVLFGASLSGEKLEPLVIGPSRKPRCFKNINSLPVLYESNKKSWMTSEIFLRYLTKINSIFTKKNKNVLIFLDNATSHQKTLFSNIKLIFLPKNTTSLLQPLDQGIIHSFKCAYKRKMIKKYISCIEVGLEPTPPTILDAMMLIKQAWECASVSTIINCFQKAGFSSRQPVPVKANSILISPDKEFIEICDITHPNILQEEIEDMIADEASIKNINMVQTLYSEKFDESSALESDDYSDDEANCEKIDILERNPISCQKALIYLKELKLFYKFHKDDRSAILASLEEDTINIISRNLTQSKITDYFHLKND